MDKAVVGEPERSRSSSSAEQRPRESVASCQAQLLAKRPCQLLALSNPATHRVPYLLSVVWPCRRWNTSMAKRRLRRCTHSLMIIDAHTGPTFKPRLQPDNQHARCQFASNDASCTAVASQLL